MESQGRFEEAIALCRESLNLKDNADGRKRLKTLESKAAAEKTRRSEAKRLAKNVYSESDMILRDGEQITVNKKALIKDSRTVMKSLRKLKVRPAVEAQPRWKGVTGQRWKMTGRPRLSVGEGGGVKTRVGRAD